MKNFLNSSSVNIIIAISYQIVIQIVLCFTKIISRCHRWNASDEVFK